MIGFVNRITRIFGFYAMKEWQVDMLDYQKCWVLYSNGFGSLQDAMEHCKEAGQKTKRDFRVNCRIVFDWYVHPK